MQKKIIALAVAGLVSGAAFAQSNVTVFGIMDIGYQYSWDNQKDSTKDKSEIKAGGRDGSRFGLRGSEDLGNGLKANFEMVAGFNGDTGTNSDYGNGGLMNEGAYVGLSGANWGEVKAGYVGTFLDDNTGIDVTGRIGAASTGVLYGTGKYQNFVAYYSPVFSGFQVKAGFSSNIGAQDVAPVENATVLNTRAYTAAASYANGGLKLGAAYAAYQPQDTNGSLAIKTDDGSEWNAGVSYDFGMASVSAFGARQENSFPATAGGAASNVESRTFWSLGVKVPFGTKDSIALGYGEVNNEYRAVAGVRPEDDDGHAVTVTYLHDISKRTSLYALYGNVNGDHDSYNIGSGYKQAFNVGVRHLF
jgi:predicted porin